MNLEDLFDNLVWFGQLLRELLQNLCIFPFDLCAEQWNHAIHHWILSFSRCSYYEFVKLFYFSNGFMMHLHYLRGMSSYLF
jgi:hypothetical protein